MMMVWWTWWTSIFFLFVLCERNTSRQHFETLRVRRRPFTEFVCAYIYTKKHQRWEARQKPTSNFASEHRPAGEGASRAARPSARTTRPCHPPTHSLARSLAHSLTHSPATHSLSRRAAQHLLLLPQQGDRQRKRHDRLRKRDRSTESMRGFCGTSALDQEHDHDSMSHWLTRTHPHSPALARRQNNQRRSTRSTTTYSGFPSSCGRLTYHIM